jgi:WD40 repeat-containing protein SMU1
MEVELQDVMKLVLQFLKEQGMSESLQILQRESGVYLNAVTDLESLLKDVLAGRWEIVLNQIFHIQISITTLQSIYEQMIYELLEAGEGTLAREIVLSAAPIQILRDRDIDRYTYLERLCREPSFDENLVYGKSSKEKRRQHIMELVRSEVRQVEPSRLLTIVQQAVAFQQEKEIIPKDGKFDLFFGSRRSNRHRTSEAIARTLTKYVRASEEEKITVVEVAPSAVMNAVIGKATGKIEVWSKETYELRQDLLYQANREFLVDTSTISACCFSKDGDYAAVGNSAGEIKIWRISTGKCMRTFPLAHTSGVISLQFSKDGTTLLSTSSDTTARLHGLKSGKTLKEFRGHTSFVNSAVFLNDNIVTGSSDGTLKFWDAVTAECVSTVRPSTQVRETVSARPIHSLMKFAQLGTDRLISVSRGPLVYLLDINGSVVSTLTHNKSKDADFIAAFVSPQGKWLYCAGEDHNLYVFDLESGQLEDTVALDTTSDVLKMTYNLQKNELVLLTVSGEVLVLSADD